MTDGGWTGGWIRMKARLHTSDFANVQPDTGVRVFTKKKIHDDHTFT